jgi:hypothetical protein
MALQVANRVQESGSANTTVSFTLSGAVTGYQSFASGITVGNTVYYASSDGTNWEVGIGTLTSSSLLTRTTILASSNSGSAVSTFGATVNVWVDYPASVAVYSSNSPNTSGYILTANGTGVAPSWQVPVGASGSYTRTTQTATASQTTFSVTYTAPYIAVYLNGVLLNTVDYTATNGTTVVLATGATVGDILDFIAYSVTSIAVAGGSNTQIQYNSSGNLAGNANFTYTGNDVNIPFGPSNSATPISRVVLALSMMT